MVPRWSPDDPWMVNKSLKQQFKKFGKSPRMVPRWSPDDPWMVKPKTKTKNKTKSPGWSPDDPCMFNKCWKPVEKKSPDGPLMVPGWSLDGQNKSKQKSNKSPRMVPGWSLDGQTKSKKKSKEVPGWSPDDPWMVRTNQVFELQMVISPYLEKVAVSLPSLFPFIVHVSTLNIEAVRD